MIPCTEAQAEAKPVSIPFQFTMDAPIEVVWAKIDDWSHDHSWVQGSQVNTSWRSMVCDVRRCCCCMDIVCSINACN